MRTVLRASSVTACAPLAGAHLEEVGEVPMGGKVVARLKCMCITCKALRLGL